MSGPSAAWALPLDERPPGLIPEQPPDGEPEPAATGEETSSPPARGGPSIPAIGSHLRVLGLEYLELNQSYGALSENVSAVVMRAPLASFIMQIDALKAVALDLQRSISRKAPRP